MDRHVEEAIAQRARLQHGLVTRAQLLEIGLRPGAIRRLVAGGRFRRRHAGVYLAGPVLPPRARELAAVLACGPRAVLSHASAAGLWELTPSRKEAPVDVSVTRTCRRRPGIRVHRVRMLDPADCTVLDGIPIMTGARTLIDLAAVVDAYELELAVARAERLCLIDRAGLLDRVSRSRGRRGMATLRAILTREVEPAFVSSEGEARLLRLLRDGGLPDPRTNVRVHGFELDLYWPDCATAVEVDGFRYHSSRDSFEHDHRRSTILGGHGIQVIAVTWRQIVDEPVATAVRIAQALARAATRKEGAHGPHEPGPGSKSAPAPGRTRPKQRTRRLPREG